MKKAILTSVLASMALWAVADTVPGLIVATAEAKTTVPINDVADVTFSDASLTVNLTDGTNAVFYHADGWTITFGEVSGITDTFTSNNCPLLVYDMRGVLVYEFPAGANSALSSLPAGTFVVKCGNHTFKVMRRL